MIQVNSKIINMFKTPKAILCGLFNRFHEIKEKENKLRVTDLQFRRKKNTQKGTQSFRKINCKRSQEIFSWI